MTTVLLVIGLLLAGAPEVSAYHGAWHPTYERIPPGGQGPLLPDPNASLWAPRQPVPSQSAPVPSWGSPYIVIQPTSGPTICIPLSGGGMVCN